MAPSSNWNGARLLISCRTCPSASAATEPSNSAPNWHSRPAKKASAGLSKQASRALGVGQHKNQVTWSDYIHELHGIPSGEFSGSVESFAALVDPRDRDRVSAALQKALAGEEDYHVEFRPVRPDGKTRWLETSGRVTFWSNGQPLIMHGAVIDTTSRRQAEEVQRDIERQLMLLVEASGALLASPHSSEVLSTITELARRFVSADAHAVWRKHEDNIWRLRSSSGLSDEYIKSGFTSGRSAQSVLKGPLLFEDIAREPLLGQRHEALIREGVRSMLAIPLHIQSDPSGTVVFYWKTPTSLRIPS